MRLDIYPCQQNAETTTDGPGAPDPRDRFVAEHLRRVFRQIYRIVRNVEDAQDVTQETFIKALVHADDLKDEHKSAHWLYRIAANTAVDFLRRNRRVQFTDIEDTLQRDDDDPERVLLRAEVRTSFDKGLTLLTPRERAALILRDVEGLPCEEVAELLNCSQATVRSHIANARTKMREHLIRKNRPRSES